MERFPEMVYSVSSTTRKPREGEREGRDYRFISEAAFQEGIASGDWIEWAKVHAHCYGTSGRFLEEALRQGCDVLLDIDVQGTRQILNKFTRCIPIFIMPPSLDVLKERLLKRRSESPASLKRRLSDAQAEIGQLEIYRHVVINDRLEEAVSELETLIRFHRTRCRNTRSAPG